MAKIATNKTLTTKGGRSAFVVQYVDQQYRVRQSHPWLVLVENNGAEWYDLNGDALHGGPIMSLNLEETLYKGIAWNCDGIHVSMEYDTIEAVQTWADDDGLQMISVVQMLRANNGNIFECGSVT